MTLVRNFACARAGRSIAARIAMMAITTNSSIRVNADERAGEPDVFFISNQLVLRGFQTRQRYCFRREQYRHRGSIVQYRIRLCSVTHRSSVQAKRLKAEV